MVDDDSATDRQRAREELDRREQEIRDQLTCWSGRLAQLESIPGPDLTAVREIALFRGRISGALAMLRHYGHERDELDAVG